MYCVTSVHKYIAQAITYGRVQSVNTYTAGATAETDNCSVVGSSQIIDIAIETVSLQQLLLWANIRGMQKSRKIGNKEYLALNSVRSHGIWLLNVVLHGLRDPV